MTVFSYIARDSGGRRVTGRLSAENEQAALAELHGRSLAPVRVHALARPPRLRRSVSTRRLATAYRQLADLLRVGMPLLAAIQLLGRGKSDPRLASVMAAIASDVAGGVRLADAMSRHPEVFPPIQVAMIRAGERGGFLDSVLARLAVFLEHQADLRAKVVGNLIYPAVLLTAGLAIVVGALVFFVPKFEEFYSRMTLPLPTRILLWLSSALTGYWLVMVLAAIAVAWVLLLAWRRPPVRAALARFQLRVPKVGALAAGLAVARFTRILGTLLGNGVPMLAAMQISREAAGHPLLAAAIDDAVEAVRAGEPLAGPLARSGMLGEDVTEMIAVGEAANNLPQVLITIADTTESRVDRMLQVAVRLMEPLLLLGLAGVVLFIFVALVVPMLRLSSAVSG